MRRENIFFAVPRWAERIDEGCSDCSTIRVPALATFSILFIHKNPFPSGNNLYKTRVQRSTPVIAARDNIYIYVYIIYMCMCVYVRMCLCTRYHLSSVVLEQCV